MARDRDEPSIDRWVETLGRQIGVQLGKVIALHLQRTIESSVDLGAFARRMGTGTGGRGRRPSANKGTCSEPGCGDLVLAKGLCRSHYYRARYQSQRGGVRRAEAGRRGKRGARNGAANAGDSTPA